MKVVKNMNESHSSGKKTLYTGVFNGQVVQASPNKVELEQLLGMEEGAIEKEIDYSGDKDGIDWVELAFWIATVGEVQQKLKTKYRIQDKVMVGSKSGKTQYVSCNGDYAWSDKKENLKESFIYWQEWSKADKAFVNILENGKPIKKEYREAMVGEADLYQFIKAWFSHVDWKKPSENSMLVDKKKLFKNPVKYAKDEYQSEIGKDETETLVDNIIGVATVYVGQKDDNKVQYQNVGKWFLADYKQAGNWSMMKKVNNLMQTEAWDTAEYDIKKWHKELTDVEFGIKENYKLQPLAEYDESEWLNESDATIKDEGEVGMDYDAPGLR